MILTNCAACAAKLAHDAPRCVRCSTRYCGEICRLDHWRRGHKQICKRISSRGGPEQIYAEKKYKEAVAVAVEACADDTKGQKCYICLEAVHSRTGEGLVRGCACGDRDGVSSPELGVAHVSCLAEQAKIMFAEAEEDKLHWRVVCDRWDQWNACSLCDQEYHGVVSCALGWACWKTYLGRPVTDQYHTRARCRLGDGLNDASRFEEALAVLELCFADARRLDQLKHETTMMTMIGNSHAALGRKRLAHDYFDLDWRTYREVLGVEHSGTYVAAFNYADSLISIKKCAKAAYFLREWIARAVDIFGPDFQYTLDLRHALARALHEDPRASQSDLTEALAILEELEPKIRKIFGNSHPHTRKNREYLEGARMRREDVDAGIYSLD